MLDLWSEKYFLDNTPYGTNETVFETSTADIYRLNIVTDGVYEVTLVGGGGAAAMKGVYDDRGYGWTGGSAGAFSGTFVLRKGKYEVVVASANNNTAGQGGNTNTMNPSDTSTHDSSIAGVLSVGGGGAGTTSGAGPAGKAGTFVIEPLTIALNSTGNAGAYGSGGKGSGANWTHDGGASVYEGYGKGQGCSTSEYANRRYWIAGTGGYIKVVYLRQVKKFNLTINTNVEGAEVVMDGITSNSLSFVEGTTVNYTVSKDGYVTQTGSVRVLEDTIVDVELAREMMTVTVNPVPDDSVVVLTADGYTQEGNSITAHKYSTITWEVTRDHYIAQSGSFVLTEATELNVELEAIMRTFTINPTPADAVVTINGEVTNSVTLLEGSEVSWSVEAKGYAKQSGEVILNEDTSIDIMLEEIKELGKFFITGYLGGGFMGSPKATNIYAYSEDGINWTKGTFPTSSMATSIAYNNNNGMVVAVQRGNEVCLNSKDGINWTQSTLPSSQEWTALTFGNDVFVAVAGHTSTTNTFAYSKDGINWTQGTLPSKQCWRYIVFGNGRFVALSYNMTGGNIFAHSEDGINWTQGTLPKNEYWYGLAFGNGRFVAVSSSSNFAYSEDGVAWTHVSPSVGISSWSSVFYSNGVFVATSDYNSKYAYSEDGINWTQGTLPSTQYWCSGASGKGRSVIACHNIGMNTNIFAHSENSINWTQSTLPVSIDWQKAVYL